MAFQVLGVSVKDNPELRLRVKLILGWSLDNPKLTLNPDLIPKLKTTQCDGPHFRVNNQFYVRGWLKKFL